jgi:hypothetical protein
MTANTSARCVQENPTAWSMVEIELRGRREGNPFADVELTAAIAGPTGGFEVTGFYDGDGRYAVRFLPDTAGTWTFVTSSTAPELDAIRGEVSVAPAQPGAHGPVRVAGWGFQYADGTRFLPLGTTAYVWTHQSKELQEQTLATLAAAPFTKIRMCVFPKHYLFNTAEPDVHGFERGADGSFDTTRIIPQFFQNFERRVADLGALGIEADVILFHPYDRWGYADLGAPGDDRYLRYVIARLSAYPNVWWSLANEFDLLRNKSLADWDRIAAVVQANDPVGHLLGNHNCMTTFDNSRPWVTHSSMQRIDVYRSAEEVTGWRERWSKPVVVDECAYEGDIDQGWGNITAEEMTRRFWEAAIRGGWCGHGETYYAEDEVLWWSKGGVLKGDSPARIAFLRTVLEDAPGDLEPNQTEWDVPSATCGDGYRLTYFSFMRPRYRTVNLPPGQWLADVIDTWGMTIAAGTEPIEGTVKVSLPGRQYIALRLRRMGG